MGVYEPPLPAQPDHRAMPSSNTKKESAEHDSKVVPQLVALLSGGLAGMVIDAALYPVDTFKTRTIREQPSLKHCHGVGLSISLPFIASQRANL